MRVYGLLFVSVSLACSSPLSSTTDGAAATGDALPDSASETDAGGPCESVQHFRFTMTQAQPLACDARAPGIVLDASIPATGAALARATLIVHHVGPQVSPVTHFWNARIDVGTPDINYAVGDDMCAGATSIRTNLGYGLLAPSASHVRVLSYQGASPCTDHALQIQPGSSLDVWVESPRSGCRNQDILVKSFYRKVDVDPNVYWEWPTSTAPILGADIETRESMEKLVVLSVIEGSPWSDPNRICGAEVATLVSQTTVDGAILSTVKDAVPASQGMGHLVLSSEGMATVAPGRHALHLLAGSNFVGRVTTGGCCGDAYLAAVRMR